MQHRSVKKLFKDQIQHYIKKDQAANSKVISLVLEWIHDKKHKKKIKICEFGVGAGQLLNEIQKKYPNVSCTDVEIIDDYKFFLVSKKITYVTGSVLNSSFPDNSFDVIIMRDILHHLVGNTYNETQKNQKKALQELKRLVRPKGIIFIEELTNESEIATRLMYYFSKLNSTLLSFASLFNVNKNTIVAFFPPRNLEQFCKEVFDNEKIIIKK